MATTIPSQLTVNEQFEIHNNSNKIFMDCAGHYPVAYFFEDSDPVDIIDNPVFLKSDATDINIFQHMKLECNRLYSFQNKWPVREITPESLAEAGFFYLQQEDIVQCPFCGIKISDWVRKDKPLREHMRKNPRCHFLMGCNVGNIPLVPEKSHENSVFEKKYLPAPVSVSYKPKHPRMADVKRRILTFSNWPLQDPAPQQLANCGLYYSGVADVVTCFFCGGALGNWDPTDNPWDEHTKFFPDCAFLAVARNRHTRSSKAVAASEVKSKETAALKQEVLSKSPPTSDFLLDIIAQAEDIFPKNLVIESVKRKGGKFFSLQELCDDILEIKQERSVKSSSATSDVKKPEVNQIGFGLRVQSENAESKDNSSCSNDVLVCKICMDRERSAVFQPCGHFVSCWNCANLVSNCPVCRRPVTHKIRTYVS